MADLAVWPTDGSGPGGDGSVSSEARWRKMARGWVPSGVDQSPLGVGGGVGALAPTLAAGPAIQVAAGSCWLDGHYAELAAPATIPASANGLLVVRFTPADNHAELLYRDAAVLPPTQTLATWELALASMAAGAMTDRRVGWRPGSPPCYPNYATLKALWPGTGVASPAAGTVPPDGYQAVTLDDGRTWTFRAAAFTYTPPGAAVPASRWETQVYAAVSKATASDGIATISAADVALDGIVYGMGHGGWDAGAPPTFGAMARWTNLGAFQMRLWSVSGVSAGTLTVKVATFVFTVSVFGYRV